MYAGRKVEEAPVGAALRAPAPPLHAGPARRGAEARLLADAATQTQARGDPGRGAEPEAAHPRLRVRRPLRHRDRPVPAERAGARDQGARPLRRLPLRAARRRSPHDARRCSRSTTSRSTSPIHGGLLRRARRPRSMRSTACPSRSTRARRWRWSASPAAASRRSAGCILRLFEITAGAGGARRPAHRRPVRRRAAAAAARACRWCSRTRSRASTRACACATSWPSRSATSAWPSPAPISRRASRALMDKVRLPRDAVEPLAARVLRRPAPAHRHRPRARRRARPHRLRRGGLGARRLGQGADRQPAAGPAAGARPRAAVHQPRPRHRRAHDAPRRGDVSRQDRRAGAEAARSSPRPSIPTREALLSAVPVPEPGAARAAHHPEGRRAEPDQSADGLPLPHPLPLRVRPLPRRGAAAAAGCGGPYGGLPSARGAAGCVTARAAGNW